MKILFQILLLLTGFVTNAQVKILFDATKAESAGNADWVIDADTYNLNYNNGPATIGGGNEANAQRIPAPAQSNIVATTAETYWSGALSNWAIDCVKKGYNVETLPYNGRITYGDITNQQDLMNYKIFVIDEPNILFTAAEKIALINFVQNGGGLFIISNHTISDRNNDGQDSPDIWNDLFFNNGTVSDPFGISIDLNKFSDLSSNKANRSNDSLLYGANGNVVQIRWSSGTSMTINPAANPTVKAVFYRTGASNTGNTNVMVAYARFGMGKVVALCDSSPFDDGTGDINDNLYDGYNDVNGNHRKLILNATDWLAASSNVLSNDVEFSCATSGSSVNISWTVSSVDDINSFIVQKSYDGLHFFNVKSMSPLGKNYSYTDENGTNTGNVYYRLSVVKKDGKIVFSKTILIKGLPNHNTLVYPNPANNIVFFKEQNISSVTITNMLGTISRIYSAVTNGLVDIRGLPKGPYIIQYNNKSGIQYSSIFIKQ